MSEPLAGGRGHPVFAAVYDRLDRFRGVGFLAEQRSRLLASADGDVLEVGAGGGANLTHYPPAVHSLTLAEPDRFMRRRLTDRAAKSARFTPIVSSAPAESLPFADGSFDTVVSTLVLCSVDHQDAALREIARVLRPGGRLLFLEHVRGARPALGRFQDAITPGWRRLAGGCHPNRDSLAAISAAGLVLEHVRATPLPGRRLFPHVEGAARRSAA